MKTEKNERDPFIKSVFEAGGLEQPSASFTNEIIGSIKAQSKETTFEYKPVISRTTWLILAGIGVAIFAYMFFGFTPESQGSNLYGYSLKVDTTFVKAFFSKIAISFELSPIFKTALIALTFFTFSHLIIFELRNRSILK